MQARPGALRQHLGKRQADGEIDAKSLPTGKHFVVARAGPIADLDVQGLFQILAALVFISGLGDEAHRHIAAAQALQDFVGAALDLGQGLLDQQGRHAVLAEGTLQLAQEAHLSSAILALGLQALAALLQIIQHQHLLAGSAHFQAQAVLLLANLQQGGLGGVQVGRLGLRFLQLIGGALVLLTQLAKFQAQCGGLLLKILQLALQRGKSGAGVFQATQVGIRGAALQFRLAGGVVLSGIVTNRLQFRIDLGQLLARLLGVGFLFQQAAYFLQARAALRFPGRLLAFQELQAAIELSQVLGSGTQVDFDTCQHLHLAIPGLHLFFKLARQRLVGAIAIAHLAALLL